MSGRVIVAIAVGAAGGGKAAAAALACAGSEPDRAGLLIDVGGCPPRPTLVASTGARELEERLAVHLPRLRAASRGQVCQLAVPDDETTFESLRAALPLVRDSVVVVHLPPARLQALLAERSMPVSGVLLRAELDDDRPLVALAVGDLIGRGLRVKVLKRSLSWVPARRALFGVLPSATSGGLPSSMLDSLLESRISVAHSCYSEIDDEEADPERTPQQQWRGYEGARRRRGLHRDPQRQAGR